MLPMKELSTHLIWLFEDSERHGKALKKARMTAEFEERVAAIFQELPLRADSAAGWRDRPIF